MAETRRRTAGAASAQQCRLDPDWARASGLFNARVTLTPDELRGVQAGLEELLEPFIAGEPGDVPD